MLLSTNHRSREHLCPHSHAWYSSGKIHLLGTLILLPVVIWESFLLSENVMTIFLGRPFSRILIAWGVSLFLELIRSFSTKKRSYLDNRFLFYPLLLMIALPLSLPLHTAILSLIFAYTLNSFIFGQRACILPFVSTGFAFAFLTLPSSFLNPTTRDHSLFVSAFLEKYGLNVPEFSWLIPDSGDFLSTLIFIYIIAALFLLVARVINFKIVFGAVGMYLVGSLILSEDIFKYPQTWFCLLIVSGDTQATPFSRIGKIVFGLLVGLFTILLQKYWYPQVASYFSILLACPFSPIINHITRPFFFKYTKRNHEVLL